MAHTCRHARLATPPASARPLVAHLSLLSTALLGAAPAHAQAPSPQLRYTVHLSGVLVHFDGRDQIHHGVGTCYRVRCAPARLSVVVRSPHAATGDARWHCFC